MTGDPFVHLHVASGYSLRHGANHPADLVLRAAEHGMGALALTDRDGLYGAVKSMPIDKARVCVGRRSVPARPRPYSVCPLRAATGRRRFPPMRKKSSSTARPAFASMN